MPEPVILLRFFNIFTLMTVSKPEYQPVQGKTYSLFGQSDSTEGYFHTISLLADKAVSMHPDIGELVSLLERFSKGKRRLRTALHETRGGNLMHEILTFVDPALRQYTGNVDMHLKTLPLKKMWDRRLATSREQYHLYMLEIELTNRLYCERFRKADRKIALLPYCLQDFSVRCKAEKSGFDYRCKHCSAKCYQNQASSILDANGIEPYIWMGGDMKQLARITIKENRTFGVLGIACIPELTWGMRSVRKKGIPVIGIPLNANRCIRWFGEFFPNSTDLIELEKLVSG